MTYISEISLKAIGNSQGFIIPKKFLQLVNTGNSSNFIIEVKENKLIITPVSKPRQGWAEAFKRQGPDELLIPDILDDDDLE